MSPIPNLPSSDPTQRIPSQRTPEDGQSQQESNNRLPDRESPTPSEGDRGTEGNSPDQLPTSGPQEDESKNNPGEGVLGDEDKNDEWQVSNQLPSVSKSRTDDSGDDQLKFPPDEESESAGEEDELDRTLSDIDGEIMSDREEERARSDQQAEGAMADAPQDSGDYGQENTSDSISGGGVGGTSTQAIPGEHEKRVSEQEAEDTPRRAVLSTRDMPDARDDDVIARQLREAALAETDPDLQESLWKEYRRYKARFK